MSTSKIFFSITFLFLSTWGYTQVVNNASELNTAISGASPGSTIILADGTWNNVFIDIDKNGTSSAPITITAQNPGAVLMTGNSRVYMEGAHLIVSGLVFQDPDNLVVSGSNIEPVFELKDCDNCKVLNNKIDTYNGTEAQKTLTFKWVLTDGENNEIAYNSFIGKYGIGSIINDNRNSSSPDYLKIHHNYFAERTPINQINEDNNQDAIRIGNSGTSLDNSNSEVYENYFYDFKGEIEIISNKSGQNKYYNNTFRDYAGTLALRHGDNCEVYGNYFFAEDNIFSGGIRVIGENHKIYNNYIEGVNSTKPDGSTSKGTGGINVSNGRLNSALNGYYQVKNAQIINNTFVNCDYALRIGTQISSDLDQAPEDLIIANNITFNSSKEDYQITTSPQGASISEGNLFDLADSEISDDNNFHRLTSGSSPIDAGIGNYSFLTQDILKADRDANFDAGAEEFGANGENLPYDEFDVGINVGFGAGSGSLGASSDKLTFGVCGSTFSFTLFANVDWTISEDLPWLNLDVTAGSGTSTITATATENTAGIIQNGTISIQEIAGGDDSSFELSVEQLLTSISFELPIGGSSAVGTQDIATVSEENAYNNDLSNYWTGNPDTEPEVSITFDLGDLYFLTDIGINFWKADERTTTFSIEIAEDAAGPFNTILDNQVSADSGVTVDTEQTFSLGATIGRYVKFIGIGNSSATNWTSIANVNIYGDINCANAASGIFDSPTIDISVDVFPVPVSDGHLNILSKSKRLGLFEVFNATGHKVLSANGQNKHQETLDVSELIPGIYFLRIEGIGTKKFVVK